MTSPLLAVILGRQGSGKGTQSELIAANYGCIHLSTGDVLRAAVAEGTELGIQAQAVMESGSLVGDDIMVGIVADRLAAADIATNGVLLDGFPRTSEQADGLETILKNNNLAMTVALNVDVPVDVVTQRMLERGRSDDTAEAIQKRLELYDSQTAPLLDWFGARGLLETVDGVGSVNEVFARVSSAIDAHR